MDAFVIENEINDFVVDVLFFIDDIIVFDDFVPYVSIDSEMNEQIQICEPSRETCESWNQPEYEN